MRPNKAPSLTGQVFGEELAALGINVNLGPCVDVITDLTDLDMSTRVFSNDPQTAAKLGTAFKNGVSESGVITTYKHFPSAGDGSDYPTFVKLTLAQLEETGLSAFRTAHKPSNCAKKTSVFQRKGLITFSKKLKLRSYRKQSAKFCAKSQQ
ncbi:MAG: hypothetical protein IJR54_07100 [Oscillibacter sp.]|nr:hypothetical protein [Oscillibacter sp.]